MGDSQRPLKLQLPEPLWRTFTKGYKRPARCVIDQLCLKSVQFVICICMPELGKVDLSDTRSFCLTLDLSVCVCLFQVPWPGHSLVDEGLLNPYINWPFDPDSTQLMTDWVKEASALNIRTKFYCELRSDLR